MSGGEAKRLTSLKNSVPFFVGPQTAPNGGCQSEAPVIARESKERSDNAAL